MRLAENIRAKVHQGVLPPGMPYWDSGRVWRRPSLQCVRWPPAQGPDSVWVRASRFGTSSFPLGCFGLYSAQVRRRGWL